MPQVTIGLDVAAVDRHDVVVGGVLRRRRGSPPARRALLERVAGRRERRPLQIGDGRRVRIDVADAGAAFDGHVAHGHAFFHGHAVEDLAAVFVGEADAALARRARG